MDIKQKGFTIIELLVVIAIIGLLSSVVLVSMKGSTGKAKIAKGLEFSQTIMNTIGVDAVGIWTFDEGSGGTANDKSGYGNHGTITGATFVDGEENTPHWFVNEGDGRSALSFDGNDYINCDKGSSLNITDAITVEAWVKFNHLDYSGGTGRLHGIAAKGNPDYSTSNYGWWFSYDNRHNRKSFVYTCFGNSSGGWAGGDNNFGNSKYNYKFTEGRFYHVVFSITQTQAKLYINGKQRGPIKSISNLQLSDTARNLYIGSLFVGAPSYYFNGIIDEVRVYAHALGSSEIQQHYADGAEKHEIALK